MKTVLVLGAGMSSSTLISNLLDHADEGGYLVKLGDISLEAAHSKIGGHPHAMAFTFDVYNEEQRNMVVSESDVVISMIPPGLHYFIALSCLKYGKNMVAASYISKQIKELDQEAREKGVLLLNEMGVDPGIDHMSAMMIIDKIKAEGGVIKVFETHTGGLVAPKYDNNPWNYKFTWNPKNVVVAGSAGAQFLHNGKFKYIPYYNIFRRAERLYVQDLGEFESYPNRDSLKYRETYGLDKVETMFRGTIRRPGFCRAWNKLVQLGATDDSYIVEGSEGLTYNDFIESFLPFKKGESLEARLSRYLDIDQDSEIMFKLRWLGLFEHTKIELKNASPAAILRQLLDAKWKMDKDDKDMIVIQNQFEFVLNNKRQRKVYSMVSYGEDSVHTAMAKTVGVPIAITARLILEGKIRLTGVHIPIKNEIYEPVMQELGKYGIRFIEEPPKYMLEADSPG